ncbi:MAG: hypothetical protein AB7K24_19110 [Gemmataceae bacterium]
MSQQSRAADPDNTWRAFTARHSGHPFLTLDPLYALVENVIDAIKAEIPNFFTPEQEEFERTLARTRSHGFFLRRVIGGELPAAASTQELEDRPIQTIGEILDELERIPKSPQEAAQVMVRRLAPVLSSDWLPDRRRDDVLARIADLIAVLREASGFKAGDVSKAMSDERREQIQLRQRQEAYAGWLVMEPLFLRELESLRRGQQQAVARFGAFPRRDTPSGSGRRTGCTAKCLAFYRRWGLEQLLTWDLPVPLRTRFELASEESASSQEAALLRIPWYLLRGGLDLRPMVRRLRHTSAPVHLRNWIIKEPTRDDDMSGDLAYQRLFWLYRCHELVLLRRYPAACARNVERLDRALAAVMGRSEDLVKKLRQRLTRARRKALKKG